MRRWLSIPFAILLFIISFGAALDKRNYHSTGYRKATIYPRDQQVAARYAHSLQRHQGQPTVLNNERPDGLIPTDMVLISSLDGSIRAVDRFKAIVYWTLPGRASGASGGTLIKSTVHIPATAKKITPDSSLGALVGSEDMVDDHNNSDNNNNDDHHRQEQHWIEQEKHDLYYIVEPHNGGGLYLYGSGKPLEKLPFTIRDIVHESPLRTRNGTTYIGSKTTLMLGIDPRSGEILQRLDLDQEQDAIYMATQKKLPPHTIYLGLDEYNVAIFDNERQRRWDLQYSEYVPNKLDFDVPANRIVSDVYIAPGADGTVTAIDATTGTELWSRDLPKPVSVFDVYRRHDYTLALCKQIPPMTLRQGIIGRMLEAMRQEQHGTPTAYVGVHEGNLYALSTENYPLAQLWPKAPVYGGLPGRDPLLLEAGDTEGDDNGNDDREDTYWSQNPNGMCFPGSKEYPVCAVGNHPVLLPPSAKQKDDPARHVALLPAAETPRSSMPYYKDEIGGFFVDGAGKFWKTYLLILATIAYIYRARLHQLYIIYVPWLIQRAKRRYKAFLRKRAKKAAAIAAATKTTKTTPEATLVDESPISRIETINQNATKPQEIPDTRELIPSTEKSSSKDTSPLSPKSSQPQKSSSSSPSPSPLPRAPLTVTKTVIQQDTDKQTESRVLKLSNSVLGYGSHGTVVYKGEFDGRQVAVKRLLIDFYDIAFHEVKLLQESDDHPNVVRYFYKEETDRFLYIALELCYGSLHEYMERTLSVPDMRMIDQMDPGEILYQIISGVQHLHSLKIVHRDIKPQNILLAPSKRSQSQIMRVLISDFGLCKKLEGEQSSFHYTAISPAGTAGWRAPELLAGVLAEASDSNTSNGTQLANGDNNNSILSPTKATRAIDIFSAGCVFYYVLSGGDHPFGDRFSRENNILKANHSLDKLQDMGEDGVEAMDLIERMISHDPKSRPNADTVLKHPFFWSPAKRLAFLQDASDRFEVERRDPPSAILQRLEGNTHQVIGYDWSRRLDRVVNNDLRKFRKYDGRRVRDLLRVLRNKKHHWSDLDESVKQVLGEPPNDYLYYFTARFPRLFLHTYYVIAENRQLRNEGSLRQYFY